MGGGPVTPRVLLVEDDDERAEWMGRELAGLTLERAPDSAHALAALEGGPVYDVIMLDYDIDPGGGGGHHVVAHLQQRSDPAVIIVHSANPLGGPWMAFALKRAGYATTYAPVFDPESPETWRSILGGEPVAGGWGCPASHPALSLSKKGECALCVLAPKTHWYYEDDQCVLLDCLTCGSPMVVSKRHDEWTEDELADLIELATEGFPDLQPRLRRGSIPDHPHFHMEERAPNPRTSLTPQAIKKLERRFRKGVKLWRGVGGPPRDPGDLGIGTYYSSYKARARQYARPDLMTDTVRLDAPWVLGDEEAYTQIADRYGTVRGPERTRGAIQATVDMIEAGHDGLVSVNTLTGGLEVVVFPALEEIVWP